MQKIDKFFDELQRIADRIAATGGNEAVRHDLLIRPILTSPHGLGWEAGEAVSQVNARVGPEVIESYYWEGAVPKKRRPDIILVPYSMGQVVGVVEEKDLQPSVRDLQRHLGQLFEYQYLHRCVWGMLTDGEKWVLTRNHEVFHQFENLRDLHKRIADLRHCIGRHSVLQRLKQYGVSDIVFVRPAPTILIAAYPGAVPSVTTLPKFLQQPRREARDLLLYLYRSLKTEVVPLIDKHRDSDIRLALSTAFGSGFGNMGIPAIGFMNLLIEPWEESEKEKPFLMHQLALASVRWTDRYPVFRQAADELIGGTVPSLPWVMELCTQTDSLFAISRCSLQFLKKARGWAESSGTTRHLSARIDEMISYQERTGVA